MADRRSPCWLLLKLHTVKDVSAPWCLLRTTGNHLLWFYSYAAPNFIIFKYSHCWFGSKCSFTILTRLFKLCQIIVLDKYLQIQFAKHFFSILKINNTTIPYSTSDPMELTDNLPITSWELTFLQYIENQQYYPKFIPYSTSDPMELTDNLPITSWELSVTRE